EHLVLDEGGLHQRVDGRGDSAAASKCDPNWAIGNAAAGATSAHHRPSAAAPRPTILHQVVCRAVSPSVPSERRGVYAGAFPRRVPVAGIKHASVNGGWCASTISSQRKGSNMDWKEHGVKIVQRENWT